MTDKGNGGNIEGQSKESSDYQEKKRLLSDAFAGCSNDLKPTLLLLQKSLDMKDENKIKEHSTKLLVSTVDARRGRIRLTTSQWKVLAEMADGEKFLKESKLKKDSTLETTSNETICMTSVNSGPSNMDALKTHPIAPTQKTLEGAGMNPDSRQQPSNIEKILADRAQEISEITAELEIERKKNNLKDQELVKLKNQLDDVLKKHTEEKKKIYEEFAKIEQEKKTIRNERDDKQRQLKEMESKLEVQNATITSLQTEKINLKAEIKKIDTDYAFTVDKICKDHMKKFDTVVEQHEQDTRRKRDELKEIMKERDDLKTRFSKLAGAKLTDQNADIADLSDPNRAMKLSEKFGLLYDDEWTDAFEYLKKKMNVKDAITLLIKMLQDCWKFCLHVRDIQMDSLKNVLLHPSQEMATFESVPKRHLGGLKDKPRVSSKDEGAVREVRRKIGVTECVVEEVKRAFLQETKTWDQKRYERKQLEECTPYLQSCAEVCWLMAIHCPPLYMKLDVKQGDTLDLNYFSNYTTQSDKIDYLVWPPLFNEENGGLLKKGVAEGIKVIKKK